MQAKPRSFLIVDDDERFASLMAQRLGKHGKCITTTTGEEALLLFEHYLENKTPFSVVFMDIEMPKMTGHEVVKQMRTIESKRGIQPTREFKLVMLTAHTDVKNVSTSFFKGGADAYIPKDAVGVIDQELTRLNVI